MFGKKERQEEYETPVVSKSSSKDVKTLIGEGCKIEGNFYIPTFSRIDGLIKGDLTGESGIIIGNQGKVEGNITAQEVIIYGSVRGNIETQRLDIKKGATLNGDIIVSHLVTEQGSVFNGLCKMNLEQDNITELPDVSVNTM